MHVWVNCVGVKPAYINATGIRAARLGVYCQTRVAAILVICSDNNRHWSAPIAAIGAGQHKVAARVRAFRQAGVILHALIIETHVAAALWDHVAAAPRPVKEVACPGTACVSA